MLGGVYGYIVYGTGSGYVNDTSPTFTFATGSGATATSSTGSGSVSFILAKTQGSGYTTAPTLSFTNGTGQTFTALVNPNINSTITDSTIVVGENGFDGISANGGNGGASKAGVGGVGGVGTTHGGYVGTAATNIGAGGGGGFSYWTTGTGASASGGAGAKGLVTITYTPSVLPVKLTSFTAQKQSSSVQLKWSTSSEQNNSHFEIQKSTDGQSFVNIGSKAGAGNSNTVLDYFFTDQSPLSGVNYYRLNQVDFDGKSTSSNPVAVTLGASTVSVTAYPNPAVNQLNVTGLVIGDRVKLLDLSGRIIKTQNFSGSNAMVLNLDKVNAGMYLLMVENSGKLTFQSKIVKN